MKKYSDFIKWLSTCPVPYEVDDLTGFDDDSIVFLTSENTDKHEDNEEELGMLIPDPLGYWFDPDVTDGSGISQRAAARTQRRWRWLVERAARARRKKLQASSFKLDNRSGIV